MVAAGGEQANRCSASGLPAGDARVSADRRAASLALSRSDRPCSYPPYVSQRPPRPGPSLRFCGSQSSFTSGELYS